MTTWLQLDKAQCQQARTSRDPRFDGRFFVAVKTTGIFCRPICPATLPKEDNVEYFANSALALQAGYRPCLRCRPDSAPDSWAWKGAETTFLRALQLIEQGTLQHSTLAQLCQRLGVSDRYLRQLFQTHLGVSPKQYAQSHQLMFAKQLLHSSTLSITDIGFACGFNSTRRFNDAFINMLKLTPSQVRRSNTTPVAKNQLTLGFRGPFDWPHMLDFYRLRAINAVEQIDTHSYQRTFTLNDTAGWFRASVTTAHQLTVEFELQDITQLRYLVATLRRLFDLNADTHAIEQHLQQCAPGLVKRSGLRIPGVWNPWEAGVRAILGQQVSVKAAIGQLNLLVETIHGDNRTACTFPTPEQIAQADISFLKMPHSRKETLTRFAQFVRQHPNADVNEWLALKGIGPWTVNYAKLRGLSQPDCFLDTDLIVKKALQRYPNLNAKNAAPWGSYATFHCWNL